MENVRGTMELGVWVVFTTEGVFTKWPMILLVHEVEIHSTEIIGKREVSWTSTLYFSIQVSSYIPWTFYTRDLLVTTVY